jgi:hypothetical protein
MAAFTRIAAAAFAIAALAARPAAAAPATSPAPANDYPTEARANYVFACMTTNGRTQEALHRCACAIDVIAAAVPFADYEKAETILRMRRVGGGGYLAQEFRVPISNAILRALQEAQAEADVTCF